MTVIMDLRCKSCGFRRIYHRILWCVAIFFLLANNKNKTKKSPRIQFFLEITVFKNVFGANFWIIFPWFLLFANEKIATNNTQTQISIANKSKTTIHVFFYSNIIIIIVICYVFD